MIYFIGNGYFIISMGPLVIEMIKATLRLDARLHIACHRQ